MTIPTDEEIRAAYDAIIEDGPMAEATLHLGFLCTKNPVLRQWLDRVTEHTPLVSRASLMAALVAGLNYGLRIGEARSRHEVRDSKKV